jgi:DNA-directed RNA polymerase sigma subunit (sigma70/sigma32)
MSLSQRGLRTVSFTKLHIFSPLYDFIMKKFSETLTEREVVVLQQRKNGMTLRDIGQHWGVKQERIRQILNKVEHKKQRYIRQSRKNLA